VPRKTCRLWSSFGLNVTSQLLGYVGCMPEARRLQRGQDEDHWGNAPQLSAVIWNIILEAQRITITTFLNLIDVIERYGSFLCCTLYTLLVRLPDVIYRVYSVVWYLTAV